MHRSAIAAVAVLVSAAASGCTAIGEQLAGREVGSVEQGDLGRPILLTREWGVVDGMLSVVVENTSDRTLRYADGVISVRTADNELLASSLEIDPACCGIVGLRPGQQYGFYLDVGSGSADAGDVEVAYRNVSWGAAAAGGEPGTIEAPASPEVEEAREVTARPVRLERDATDPAVAADAADAVVVAELTTETAQPEVIAQAFVTDASGALVAVVSGRWSCLRPGTQPIRMQLFHPLPADAEVDRVVVHPVAEDPTRPAPGCTPG